MLTRLSLRTKLMTLAAFSALSIGVGISEKTRRTHVGARVAPS